MCFTCVSRRTRAPSNARLAITVEPALPRFRRGCGASDRCPGARPIVGAADGGHVASPSHRSEGQVLARLREHLTDWSDWSDCGDCTPITIAFPLVTVSWTGWTSRTAEYRPPRAWSDCRTGCSCLPRLQPTAVKVRRPRPPRLPAEAVPRTHRDLQANPRPLQGHLRDVELRGSGLDR